MNWIDLHVHSTASDGTCEPEHLPCQVLETIKQHGEENRYSNFILALTDHDTLAGIKRLKEAARKDQRFHIIPGVEISCDYCGKEIHMLGLGVDEENEEILNYLAYFRNFRKIRNEKILQKFTEIGIEIQQEDIQVREGETLGRPHIARYLMVHGYVSSVKEAFDLYLGDGKICNVKREKAVPEQAIQIIHKAGGKAVLAHPLQYKNFTETELINMIKKLKDEGLDGIETYYTGFSEKEIELIEGLSDKYSLIRTGGSDYHGYNKPDIELGRIPAPEAFLSCFLNTFLIN